MENIHRLTKQTMELVGQTVRDSPSIPTVEEMKLRLALEFEELKEKAQAMGLEGSFAVICDKFVNEIAEGQLPGAGSPSKIDNECYYNLLREADTGVVDLVEVLDAALDQRVVASGTDLCFGFQEIIVEGDVAVWTSNMSKFDRNIDDAVKGIAAYLDGTHPHGKGKIDVYLHSKDGHHIIKRKDNNKYLKSLNYSAVDLRSLVGITEPINTEEDGKES